MLDSPCTSRKTKSTRSTYLICAASKSSPSSLGSGRRKEERNRFPSADREACRYVIIFVLALLNRLTKSNERIVSAVETLAAKSLREEPLMNPTLREATVSDADWYVGHVHALAAELESQIPLQPGEVFRTAAQQAELFGGAAVRGDLFLIAEIDGRRIGELNLRRGSRPAFRHSAVLGISIAGEWRNQRIGSSLMQRALAWAEADGALRRIELQVFATNAPGIRLYQRFGFVIEGRRVAAVRMGDQFVDDLLMARVTESPAQPAEPALHSNERPLINDSTPAAVVQRQLDAYNARDLEGLLATYAHAAQLFEHPSKLLASGRQELRERFAVRFQEPNLHAELLHRITTGSVVIDHEKITRTFPEGPGEIELVMIYEVTGNQIAKASTIVGKRTLFGEPSCPKP